MSLSTRILIGMGLGILSGIFFGEQAAFLKLPGDAFVLLMQMTVLPYIMVSLIAGLGGLSFREAARKLTECILSAAGSVGQDQGARDRSDVKWQLILPIPPKQAIIDLRLLGVSLRSAKYAWFGFHLNLLSEVEGTTGMGALPEERERIRQLILPMCPLCLC